jgi:hypothetical protein
VGAGTGVSIRSETAAELGVTERDLGSVGAASKAIGPKVAGR